MKSRVHPTYKTKYRVKNWASYDRALVRRGDVTVWFSAAAIAAWEPARVGRRGGQLRYSDLAIETALTIRLIFTLPLRQTEGFLTSLFGLMGLDLPAPDHTTLSRRGQHLKLTLRRVPRGEPHAPHRRQHGTLDSRRRRMGRRETRRTRHAWLEEAPCCGQPIGCDHRRSLGVDEWPAAGRSTNPVAPVAARYQREEVVPNPANPMVGLRFTGKPCDAVVRVDDSGAARVESSFVPGRAVGLTPVADTFYLGELGDGSALVVQFDGDGALLDLTYTSYDEAGDLNYGVSGAGTFSQECVQIKRLE